MNIVVTIFQFRRAVLPHLFLKHCLPVMRAACPGRVTAWIVRDTGVVKGTVHTSARVYSDAKRDLIEQWTDDGRYAGAEIIRHAEPLDGNYPQLLPSYRIGMEIALREQADFHLWIEDDAIVLDRGCGDWGRCLAGRDAAVYWQEPFICPAFFVSTPAFDRRLLPVVRDRSIAGIHVPFAASRHWRPGVGGIEYYTTWAAAGPWCVLDSACAARVHSRAESFNLVQFVRRMAPRDVPLLGVDFPGIRLKASVYGMARQIFGDRR